MKKILMMFIAIIMVMSTPIYSQAKTSESNQRALLTALESRQAFITLPDKIEYEKLSELNDYLDELMIVRGDLIVGSNANIQAARIECNGSDTSDWVISEVFIYQEPCTEDGIPHEDYFKMSDEEYSKRQAEMEKVVKTYVKATKGMCEYDKVYYIYKRLVDSTVYDIHTRDIYNVIVNGKGCCMPITRAFDYICYRCGIATCRTASVSRQVDWSGGGYGNRHTWSEVCIQGKWYHADVTGDLGSKEIEWQSFLLSDEEIQKTNIDFTPTGHICKKNYMNLEMTPLSVAPDFTEKMIQKRGKKIYLKFPKNKNYRRWEVRQSNKLNKLSSAKKIMVKSGRIKCSKRYVAIRYVTRNGEYSPWEHRKIK